MLTALLFVAALAGELPPELEGDPTGPELHAAGQRYLQAGDLGAAVEVLDRAVSKMSDGTDVRLALATALSRIRTERSGDICLYGAFPDLILDLLDQAVERDITLRWALTDQPEYAPIRAAVGSTLRFRHMVERKPLKKKYWEAVLTAQPWFGTDGDGLPTRLVLAPGGEATLTGVELDASGLERPWSRTGTWAIDKKDVVVAIDVPQHLELTPTGLAHEGAVVWRDLPPDCE